LHDYGFSIDLLLRDRKPGNFVFFMTVPDLLEVIGKKAEAPGS